MENDYIKQPELLEKLPFSRQTLYRKIKDGTFPKPIRFNPKVIVWKKETIEKWFSKNVEGK